jgi:hypothetical protein
VYLSATIAPLILALALGEPTPKMEGWDTPDQSKPGATVAASLFDL